MRKGYAGSDHEFDKLWRDVIEPEWQRSAFDGRH